MPYHCIAVPLFALQVASDLFTVSKMQIADSHALFHNGTDF
jgi:hypothetical protein